MAFPTAAFVIWTQETCTSCFAVVDPMMKPWQQFNFGYLYSMQNGHNFILLVILHILTACSNATELLGVGSFA